MNKLTSGIARRKLRSSEWFNDPHNPAMTALYLERYLNYGLTRAELQSGKPIIGIAQTGNDLSPCNRHHLELAHRVREGIRAAGGIDGTRSAEAIVAGPRCPIAGRISMDLMAVDITDLPPNAVKRGGMVTLIGDGITVDELAHHFGTIGYEVLTSLGRRYARVYRSAAD